MRRLCRMRMGDRTMLRTVAASSGCTTAGSSNSRRRSRVNSANPNSPPWPTTTPVRSDLNQLDVAGFATKVTTVALSSNIPARIAATKWKMPQQQPDIEQHAHSDEEETEQHLAIRTDRRLDLVTKLRFREHHAGEERRRAQATGLPRE